MTNNSSIAIIDCFSGISGDMMLGALIDAGVPAAFLQKQLNQLGLKEIQLSVKETRRHHIRALHVEIIFDEHRQPQRDLNAIREMVEKSGFSDNLKNKILAAFEELASAEARVHGNARENVRSHEKGAVDLIADIAGAMIGFDYLKISKVYGRPVPLGSGFTNTAIGVMPVPSPAAVEILKNYPLVYVESGYEMTTPTGAALLKTLVEEVTAADIGISSLQTGYGAGKFESEKFPNVLRLIVGQEYLMKTGSSQTF